MFLLAGDIEEFPALDPIPSFPVTVDGTTNEVKLTISKDFLSNKSTSKMLCKRDENNDNVVVIIGSGRENELVKYDDLFNTTFGFLGGAGHGCAETLRQEGFTGQVIMITKEKYIPYDRTKLSKAMNSHGSKLALRSEEYYKVCILFGLEILHSYSEISN